MKISLLLSFVVASLMAWASPVQADPFVAYNTVTYYHNDVTGSPVVATNQQAQVVWRKTYTPYGESTGKDSDNRKGFTGHVEDANGLVYAGARYYDPALGRFLSTDSVGFNEKNLMSFNRYAYANNNPYRYVDPDGRTAHDVEVARRIASATQLDLRFPSAIGMVDFGKSTMLKALYEVDENTAGLTNPGQTILVSYRFYNGELDDDQAAELLDTVIHEGVHYSLPIGDEKQIEGNRTGYTYDEAKRRTTKELVDRFNKERKLKSSGDGDAPKKI